MDTEKENTNLNMIVAAYVKLTQLNASLMSTKEEWEQALSLLGRLDKQKVVSLSDKDYKSMILVRAELKRVLDMIGEFKFKYDPEVYVGEMLKRMQDKHRA